MEAYPIMFSFIAMKLQSLLFRLSLFVSGYFVAFAARTSKTGVKRECNLTNQQIDYPIIIWVPSDHPPPEIPATLQEVLTLYYYIPVDHPILFALADPGSPGEDH